MVPSSNILKQLSYIGVLTALMGAVEIGLASKSMGTLPPQQSLPALASTSEGLLAQAPSPPLLQFGNEGPEVQTLQSLLQLLGYYSGQIDGRYQESTVVAVSAFQNAAGLNEDGIVGPTTWQKLLPSVAQVRANGDSVTPTTASTPPASTVSSTSSSTSTQASASESNGSAETTDAGADTEPASTGSAATSPAAEDIRLPTLRRGMRGPAVRNLQERLSTLGLLQGSVDGVFGGQTEESVKSAQRYFDLTPDGVVGAATWRALLQ